MISFSKQSVLFRTTKYFSKENKLYFSVSFFYKKYTPAANLSFSTILPQNANFSFLSTILPQKTYFLHFLIKQHNFEAKFFEFFFFSYVISIGPFQDQNIFFKKSLKSDSINLLCIYVLIFLNKSNFCFLFIPSVRSSEKIEQNYFLIKNLTVFSIHLLSEFCEKFNCVLRYTLKRDHNKS